MLKILTILFIITLHIPNKAGPYYILVVKSRLWWSWVWPTHTKNVPLDKCLNIMENGGWQFLSPTSPETILVVLQCVGSTGGLKDYVFIVYRW